MVWPKVEDEREIEEIGEGMRRGEEKIRSVVVLDFSEYFLPLIFGSMNPLNRYQRSLIFTTTNRRPN